MKNDRSISNRGRQDERPPLGAWDPLKLGTPLGWDTLRCRPPCWGLALEDVAFHDLDCPSFLKKAPLLRLHEYWN